MSAEDLYIILNCTELYLLVRVWSTEQPYGHVTAKGTGFFHTFVNNMATHGLALLAD